MIAVIVAGKSIHIHLVSSSDFELVSSAFWDFILFLFWEREWWSVLLISDRMTVRILLEGELESTPEKIASVHILELYFLFSVHNWGDKGKVIFFALQFDNLLGKTHTKISVLNAFFCSCASFLFSLSLFLSSLEQFQYKFVQKEKCPDFKGPKNRL